MSETTTTVPETIDVTAAIGEVSVAEFASLYNAVRTAVDMFGAAQLVPLEDRFITFMLEMNDKYGNDRIQAVADAQAKELREEAERIVARNVAAKGQKAAQENGI
jgi:predicted KAP-like P-loop ATPase